MVGTLTTVLFVVSAFEAAWGSVLVPSNVGIIGGNAISIKNAPFMASVFVDGEAVCAGTVVHERFILTAAYCLLGNSGNTWKVLVGSDHRDNAVGFIEVDSTYKFHPTELFENVCLLRLKKAIRFSPRVAKAILFDSDVAIPEGTMVNVTGWGRTLAHGDNPNALYQATISVIGNEYCRSLRNTLICAGSARRGACYGDIGGALTYNNVQVGVVSMVNPGCVQPAIFARVSHYAKWIKKIILNNQ